MDTQLVNQNRFYAGGQQRLEILGQMIIEHVRALKNATSKSKKP
ncbi:MAG: hypothetical protein ACK4UK_00505 [Flavobacterium sp.]